MVDYDPNNPTDVEAIGIINRTLSSGRPSDAFDSPDAVARMHQMLNANPQLKADVESAYQGRVEARQHGFSSAEEYFGVSKYFAQGPSKQGQIIKTVKKTPQEMEAMQQRKLEAQTITLQQRQAIVRQEFLQKVKNIKQDENLISQQRQQKLRNIQQQYGKDIKRAGQGFVGLTHQEKQKVVEEGLKYRVGKVMEQKEKALSWWEKTNLKIGKKYFPKLSILKSYEKLLIKKTLPKEIIKFDKMAEDKFYMEQKYGGYIKAKRKLKVGILPYQSWEKGLYNSVSQRPLLFAGTFAASVVIPPLVSGIGLVSSAVIGASATQFIGEGISYTIPTIYTAYSVGRIAEEPNILKKFEKAGSITGEIAPAIAGGWIGGKLATKVKALGQPTIKYKTIKVKETLTPKQQRATILKKGELIKTDVYGKTTVTQSYKTTKLTEHIVAGRRTIVSTKLREIFGVKPIYEGIPYQQQTFYSVKGFRAEFSYRGESGYTKAFKLLTQQRGFTSSQATTILRYYQPRDIVTKFAGTVTLKYGDLYKAPVFKVQGVKDITYQVRTIDAGLGIKTRGGVGIKEIITGKGFIAGEQGGLQFYKTTFDVTKTLLTSQGGMYQKISQAGKTQKIIEQISAVKGKGTDVVRIKLDEGLYQEIPTKLFKQVSIGKQVIPKGRVGFEVSDIQIPKTKYGRVEIDMREVLGVSAKESPIVSNIKIDMNKLKDITYLKDVKQTLENVYGKSIIKTSPIISPKKPPTIKTTLKTEELTASIIPTLDFSRSYPSIVQEAGKGVSAFSISTASLGAISNAFETGQVPRYKVVTRQSFDFKTVVKTKPELRTYQRFETIQTSKITQPVVLRTIQQPTTPTPSIILPPSLLYKPKPRPKIFETPAIILPWSSPSKKSTQVKNLYSVSVRRRGKFKPVGVFQSLRKAFYVGKSKVGGTLAATFKVTGVGAIGTPRGFKRKKTKEGVLFIEQPKYRLSTRSELSEIFRAKRKKKKTKRRKR